MLSPFSLRRSGALVAFALLCSLAFSPAVAAERATLYFYTAAVPAGWTLDEEGDTAIVARADGALSFSVHSVRYENSDEEKQARATAGEGGMYRVLENGGYIVEGEGGERIWGRISDDGLWFEITVTEANPELYAFLGSIKPEPRAAESMETAIMPAMLSAETRAWLEFATPAARDAPEGWLQGVVIETFEYAKDGLYGKIPVGWTVDTREGGVLFTSPDEERGVYARIEELPSDDWDEFITLGETMCAELDSEKPQVVEGALECVLDDGNRLILSPSGEQLLVLLYVGNGPEMDAVFVGLAEE